eukprot:5460752-Ditylum_brightwellii.AAC.1
MKQNQVSTALLAHSTCDDVYMQYSDMAIYELLTNKSKKKACARFLNTAVKPVLHSVLLDDGYKQM